jgi:F-type H+-transporting ATPase subunit delta
MNDIRVASRYAKSLLQLSIELDKVQETFSDMELIQRTCEESKELGLLLKSPLIKPDKKQAILKAIFGNVIGELTNGFVDLIVKKKREVLLEEITNQFVNQYRLHKNIKVATVTTAFALNDKLREEMPELIKRIMNTDSSIELTEHIEEDLLGGMVIRVNDQQLDDSIRRKLMALEMEFSKNPYVKKF